MNNNERITMLLPRCAGMLQFLTRFINQDVKIQCPKCKGVDRMKMQDFVSIEAVSNPVGSYNPPQNDKDIRAIRQGKERVRPVRSDGAVSIFVCHCGHRGMMEEFICPEQWEAMGEVK